MKISENEWKNRKCDWKMCDECNIDDEYYSEYGNRFGDLISVYKCPTCGQLDADDPAVY